MQSAIGHSLNSDDMTLLIGGILDLSGFEEHKVVQMKFEKRVERLCLGARE